MPRSLVRTNWTRVLNFRQRRQFLFNLGQRVRDREAFAKDDFVRLAKGIYGFFGNAVALETDLVDGARFSRIAVDDHERRHVLHDLGAAADHGHLSDATELMHGHMPPTIAWSSTETWPATLAIETTMWLPRCHCARCGCRKGCVVRADGGHFAVAGRAVDRDAFTERVAVANSVRVMPPFHFKSCVLRPMLAKGKYFILATQPGVAVDDHVANAAGSAARA